MILKKWLKMVDMGIASMARDLGISRQRLHRIVMHGAIPRKELMKKIARYTRNKVSAEDYYK